MKVLLGATAAVALLASPALAQTGNANQCSFTAAPTLADGANATRQVMESKGEEINAWLATRQQEEAACAAAIQALQAQAQALNETRLASGQERQTIVQTWNTEIQEFGGRSGSSSRRDRGGVLTRPDGQ
jgi:hypothetical protein